MANVGVKVGFDGREVTTGFQRLTGSAEKFAGDLEKKLSFKGVASSVLSGVGIGSGFALAEKAASAIAGYWERAAEAAKSIADASEQTTQNVLARLRINETPKQEITRLERESANLRRPQSAGGQSLASSIFATQGGMAAGLGQALGLVSSPEKEAEAARVKAAQNEVIATKNDLRIAELKKQLAAEYLAAETAAQQKLQALNALKESNALAELDNAGRAKALNEKIAALRSTGTLSDALSAESLVPAAKAALDAAIKDELGGLGKAQPKSSSFSPAIVANSLAKIGGGGNIGVFGSGDPALAEARTQTQLLTRIAQNTAAGGKGFITTAPASDIGN